MSNKNPQPMSEFINSNYQLFAIIGVFAALVVYFNQLNNDSSYLEVAITGALLLLLTSCSIILGKVLINSVYTKLERII